MKLQRIFALIIFLFSGFNLFAQFYVTGDDPGRLKWQSIDSENYTIIYPRGLDSLAKVYGRNLETYRLPLSRSIGYLGSGGFGKKMPVVLHTYNSFSNGSVAWAPKRMDLYTIPSAIAPEATPWPTHLAIHEGRHVSQMQFGMTKALKPGNYIFGEMWNIAVSLLYPGMAGLEGDAVIMETALTKSGRGRTAEFLNYYRVAFDEGNFRKWAQWRYGSQRHYTPNYYALGYLTYGGIRWKWDNTDLMQRFYNLAASKPYRFGALSNVVTEITGKKRRDAFQDVCQSMHQHWAADSLSRSPFMPAEQITKTPSKYTEYTSLIFVDDELYAHKRGFVNTGTLVEISPSGEERTISRFSSQIGAVDYSDNLKHFIWSEQIPDKRWSLKSTSHIRTKHIDRTKKRNLRTKGLFYNPYVNQKDDRVLVAEYFPEGGSAATILDGRIGLTIKSYKAPDSLQVTEVTWLDNDIYALALSNNGFGIYQVNEDGWEEVLPPLPISMRDIITLEDEKEKLFFTCDRTGVNEFYSLDIKNKDIHQITNSKYGATEYVFDDDEEYLYYSSLRPKGHLIFRTKIEDLYNKKVDITDLYKYPIAEKLTEQELALSEEKEIPKLLEDVKFSEPQKYRKFPTMFNVHSWAPLYVNVDNIMKMSYDYIYDLASLGTTGIVQNRLSTFRGSFGYSAHKDPNDRTNWRHSAHAKLTYSGLYPVFELSVDFNDREAMQYFTFAYLTGTSATFGIVRQAAKRPYLKAQLSTYIPFNLSSGGWYRGFIPKLNYAFTNDCFDSDVRWIYKGTEDFPYLENHISDKDFYKLYNRTKPEEFKGKNSYIRYLSGSLRYYSILSTPNSCIFPRWGLGVEIGGKLNLGREDFFTPVGYYYLYGYVPGITPEQGIKLTIMYQKSFKTNKYINVGSPVVNILPRGLNQKTDVLNTLSQKSKTIFKTTLDYGVPIYIGDISVLRGLFYIKRLELVPHFDFMMSQVGSLYSAGATASLAFTSIFGLEWPFSFGITYSYNNGSGSIVNQIFSKSQDHHFVGPAFSISF